MPYKAERRSTPKTPDTGSKVGLWIKTVVWAMGSGRGIQMSGAKSRKTHSPESKAKVGLESQSLSPSTRSMSGHGEQ